MNTTLAFSSPAAEAAPRENLYIDGVPVNELFDRVYLATSEMARRFEKQLAFDVIAWSELCVAADHEALAGALIRAVRWCLAAPDTHRVTVRVYPCADDVWAIFHIQADRHVDEQVAAEAWKPTLVAMRGVVQRMGGEWDSVSGYSDCRRITFRLPQWVGPDMEAPVPMRQAS